MANIKRIQIDSTSYDIVAEAISATYSQLKSLRDNSQLVPGMWYRVTDYACTSTQTYTRVAGHSFDILVQATDANVLSEDAKACHHSGDTYFTHCKLEAWELKYCIDNDTSRFQWADDTNGKGVVYYMKDEFNNECPYDFKNILFRRWAIEELGVGSQDSSEAALTVDGGQNQYGYYYGAKLLDDSLVPSSATFGSDSDYFYTFALKDLGAGDWHDYTVAVYSIIMNDVNVQMCCFDNHISPAVDEYNGNNGNMTQVLNNIVMFNCCTDLSYGDEEPQGDYSYCNGNRFAGNCVNNTFGNNCYSNTFGNGFYNNTFGNYCQSNTFGNNCYGNTFGNDCNGNTFGNYCQNNTFGNNCYRNTFGNNCDSNTFGNDCGSNTFGNGCYGNRFGNYCQSNTFGNNCGSNRFGNDCYSNTFGNGFYNNTFGNYCENNTFGNDFRYNTFGNNVRYLTVFEGVMYCNVSGAGIENKYVQNAQILNGVRGHDSQNLLTISFVESVNYTQVACLNSSNVLKIYCPADNVQ